MDLTKPSTWYTLVGVFTFIALVMYGQVLGFDFVRWDDGLLIYENPAIRGFSWPNLKTIFSTYDPELYIPLTLLSYQLDYTIAGANPAMYHAHNLVLHILNAVLLTGLVKMLFKKSSLALGVGLLFLVHPLHTEAVIWASARKDLLSSTLFLLSIIFFVQLRETEHHKWYLLSLAAFTLGLLAKVTVLTLPAVLLLIMWLQDGNIRLSSIKKLLPYIVLSGIFAIVAVNGKTAVLNAVTPVETVAMIGKSTMFYLVKLFAPIHLSVLYPYNKPIELLSPDFLVPWVILIGIAVVALVTLRRTRLIVFGLALFAVTLSPSLFNFSKAGTYYIASDRYAYLPSIGIFVLVAFGISATCKKLQKEVLTMPVTIVIALSLAIAASVQSRVWASSEQLFTNVLKHYPDSYVAHNNIGNVYRRQGEVSSAISEYRKALDIETPLAESSPRKDAQLMSNLGSALRAQGKLEEAMQQFTQARALDSLNPQVHLGMAITYQQMGKLQQAEAAFLKAIELQPNLAVAYVNLGALYMAMNEVDDAISQYETAIEMNPHFPQAHYNLGIALRKQQRNREARDAFEKAVDLQPNFTAARINLGIIYVERKEIDAAIEQFTEVLRYDPQDNRALSALRQLGVL